jgi:hypothetical protein
LSESEVQNGLFNAALACGLVKDDGADSVRATIASGATAGLQQPRPVPERTPTVTTIKPETLAALMAAGTTRPPPLGLRAGWQAHCKDRALAGLARHRHIAAHHAGELAPGGRPSPVPPKRCASAWLNSSNNFACCPGVMPIPVSETDSAIQWRAVMTIISVSPMMALSGVRSSWLTLDMNREFVFACPAPVRLVGWAHMNANDLWRMLGWEFPRWWRR